MKITINLLPGTKKKKKGGAGISLPDFKQLAKEVKDPLLLGAIGSLTVGAAATAGIFLFENARRGNLEPEVEALRREANNFQAMIDERDRQQALYDSLVSELTIIRRIDSERFIWPHIMDEVSKALPEFTWIVRLDAMPAQDITLEDGTTIPGPIRFGLEGRTSAMQAFTRFVSQLEGSPWIKDVNPGGTNTVMEAEQQMISFTIEGTFERADSAFIQTQTLQEMYGGGI